METTGSEMMALHESSYDGSGGSDSEGSYQTPPDPLYDKRQRVENPDLDYILNDEIAPQRNKRQMFAQEATTSLAPLEQLTAPSLSSTEPKRKRGQRKRNKLSKAVYVVTSVNKFGAPIEPDGINAKWRNDCGIMAREKCKIIWDNWKNVDDAEKDALWYEMKQRYLFPPEMQEDGKKATIDTIGRCLRTFRCNLNRDFVKKGLTPFANFEFIKPEEWTLFVAQKSSERALELSEKFSDLSKKNKFSHNLGPGGYQAKITKWRKKEQEDREAGKPDELEGCSERTRNWILGRCATTKEGQLVPKNSEVNEVVQRAKDIAAKEKEGKFKPKRQNDQLTAALGTEEHRGRTRAVSSRAGWKLGFPDHVSSYKKYEQPKEDKGPEKLEMWKQHFFQFIKENPQFLRPVPVPEVRLNLDNDIQSFSSVDNIRYPVDSITKQTPCSLHIPVGRRGNTVEVAKGIVILGRIFHNTPIQKECAKVLVLEVLHEKFNKYELDYPIPDEGIQTVGDALNNIILWHRQDIILHTPVTVTPCLLHVPIGRKGNIVEVAKGIAIPGRIFHNTPIQKEYAKVLVLEIVHEKFNNNELDYPIPDEGIETLRDAVNNIILWHQQDIILHTPVVVTHDLLKVTTKGQLPPHEKEAHAIPTSRLPPSCLLRDEASETNAVQGLPPLPPPPPTMEKESVDAPCSPPPPTLPPSQVVEHEPTAAVVLHQPPLQPPTKRRSSRLARLQPSDSLRRSPPAARTSRGAAMRLPCLLNQAVLPSTSRGCDSQ